MRTPRPRVFDRVLVIMLENQYRAYALENPYLRSLARQGVLVENYNGVMHPSQTNYIATLAGELCNVTSDDPPPRLQQRTLVDLFEEAGLGWRAYMQGYRPGKTPWSPDLTPQDDFPYALKHNPFASFARIVGDAERWAKIGTEADFFADVLNGSLPEFAWFTPDQWCDGHYTIGTEVEPEVRAPALVDQCASWLRGFFARLRFPGPASHLPPRTLVVVTFDEADYEQGYTQAMESTYDGPNQVYTLLLGDWLRPAVESAEGYNHYSLLRTIEENFALGDLGKNDAEASFFRFLWGRRFEWGPATPLPLRTTGPVAAASYAARLHLALVDERGDIVVYAVDDLGPTQVTTIEGPCTGALAMVEVAAGLLLVWRDGAGDLRAVTVDAVARHAPAPAQTLAGGVSGAAVLELPAGGALLAWETADGTLASRTSPDGREWAAAETCGPTTSGGLALARQGATVHLIFPQANRLRWLTRNLGEFNVVTVPGSKYGGSWDDTSVNAWSPCSFPVAGFSSSPDPATPGELEPTTAPHRGRAPLAAATLDGVVHLVHRCPDDERLATTTFSIPGLLTPTKPVDYNQSYLDERFSNGFGTAAQAGWSPQRLLERGDGRALALTRCGETLALVLVGSEGELQLVTGRDREAR